MTRCRVTPMPDPSPVPAALTEAARRRAEEAERRAREMTAELPEDQRAMLQMKGMIK